MKKPNLLVFFIVVFQIMSIVIGFYTAFADQWVSGRTECNTTCGLRQALTAAGFVFNQSVTDQNEQLFQQVYLATEPKSNEPNSNESSQRSCRLTPEVISLVETLFDRDPNAATSSASTGQVGPGRNKHLFMTTSPF